MMMSNARTINDSFLSIDVKESSRVGGFFFYLLVSVAINSPNKKYYVI